ncbi:MAG: hypothetical protein QM541_10320 [Flavobacterium sp.]|nr:hypothetical protein [Flavobacterium sp.]
MATQKTPTELLLEVYNKAMLVVGLNDKNVTELQQSDKNYSI